MARPAGLVLAAVAAGTVAFAGAASAQVAGVGTVLSAPARRCRPMPATAFGVLVGLAAG